jgi:hypothetical protein
VGTALNRKEEVIEMEYLKPSEFAESVEAVKTVLLRPKNRKKWIVVVTGRDGKKYPLCDNWRKPKRFEDCASARKFAEKNHFAVVGVSDQSADFTAAIEIAGLKSELIHACKRFRGGRGLFPAAIRSELEHLGRTFLQPSSESEWSELDFLIEFYVALAVEGDRQVEQHHFDEANKWVPGVHKELVRFVRSQFTNKAEE